MFTLGKNDFLTKLLIKLGFGWIARETGWANDLAEFTAAFTAGGVSVSGFGAIGDGVNDDTTFIQAALDACAISGSPLIFEADKIYKVTATLHWKQLHAIVGHNSRIATSATIGITVYTPRPDGAPEYNAVCFPMVGMQISGARSTGRIGIQLGGGNPSTDICANVCFQNCTFRTFDKAFTFIAPSYLHRWVNCNIYDCNWCIYFDTTAGSEKNSLVGSNLFNCTSAVYNNAGDFYFTNCSLDYFANYAILNIAGGNIALSQCHVEASADGDDWFRCEGAASILTVRDSFLYATGNRTHYFGRATAAGTDDAGILVANCRTSYTGTYSLATLFTGAVRVNGNQQAQTTSNVKITSDSTNRLGDGGMEGSSSLLEWTLTGAVPPVQSADFANTGTKSMKFSAAVSQVSQAVANISVRPGDLVTLKYLLRTAFANAGDSFAVSITFRNTALAVNINAPSFNTRTHTSVANPSVGAFTEFTLRAFARVPAGADIARVTMVLTGTTGGSLTYVDDVAIETI